MVKNYNKILEAINKGIKFALDDFDDQEEIQGQTNSKVNNTSNLKEYLEWKELTKKFELEQQIASDISRLAELSKLLNLKYKISLERLYNFIRHYLNKTKSLHYADLNWIDTSGIYTMENLFYNSYFNGDISNWDVSNVKNMSQMFYNSYFNGDISNWDVSNVESMHGMFQYTRFNNDISKWNVSKCRDFGNMFMNDTIFCQDLSNWKIKKGSNIGMIFWETKITSYNKYMPQVV